MITRNLTLSPCYDNHIAPEPQRNLQRSAKILRTKGINQVAKKIECCRGQSNMKYLRYLSVVEFVLAIRDLCQTERI